MSRVVAAVGRVARADPGRVALTAAGCSVTYAELDDAIARTADDLRAARVRRLGLALDNGAAWVVADLAAVAAGVAVVPLPSFFTGTQRDHAILDAALDAVLEPAGAETPASWSIAGTACRLVVYRSERAADLPVGTAKVTYTSGTTGAPKGVCLSQDHLESVAAALAGAVGLTESDTHVCVLPLSTLLENVAGVYAPLLAGARCAVPSLAAIGLSGSSGLDVPAFVRGLRAAHPTTTILIPHMLEALVTAGEHGAALPDVLRFVAVGGARVAPDLLRRAAWLGLPVFQGYGLSECGSVVSLNTVGADRPGSVGKPLPHVDIAVDGGEIVVRRSVMLGYAGRAGASPDTWRTGDLGHFDADGFLHVTGRKRNVLINAFGRNVSPEWVESELVAEPPIAQAVVFGEARPWLCAVIVPRCHVSDADVDAAVAAANARLPDYARVRRWIRVEAPLTAAAGDLTPNGRPRRERILLRHAQHIDSLYTEHRMTFHESLVTATRTERDALLATPFIRDGAAGRLTLADYVTFLGEAYHHVKHTLPLLMACGARLPERLEWLRREMTHYVDEETGHQDWILADIAACGADADHVRHGQPAWPAEVMVAYAYDIIARGNPVAFLGMVLVLEGTSTAVAIQAAQALAASLELPRQAFTYLNSHGALDVGHMDFYAKLVNRLDDEGDRAAILHGAKRFYRLYGDVFRELDERRTRHPGLKEAA